MIALPLSILALAAGVYLLIKVNREYLGGIFKFFAWLIILLSLVAVGSVVRHAVHHHFHGGMRHGECQMEERVMIKEFKHCDMGNDSTCPMAGCKMMGDSVILDRAVCEKMMGKEACEKLCKDRGQCIMTKDECAKMCGGTMKCGVMMGQNACCKEGNKCCTESGDKACCKAMGAEKEMKECCKKK